MKDEPLHKRRIKKKPGADEAKTYTVGKDRDYRQHEPSCTATFWRNSFEHERVRNVGMHKEVLAMRAEFDRTREELDRLRKRL